MAQRIITQVDDDTLDRETWSADQNEYASMYMTSDDDDSIRPDLVTRSNNRTKKISKRSVGQTKNINNIVTIGTSSFGAAFKQARKAGLDKFRWKGRVYGTRYASEVNNISNVQGNTNTSVKSGVSTKNNTSNTGTKTITTPRRTFGATVQRQTIKRLNFDNNENKNQLYYSTAALNNKINSMPTLRDNTTPTFYEARRRAQQLGQKSFTWRGNTYSTYGRTK